LSEIVLNCKDFISYLGDHDDSGEFSVMMLSQFVCANSKGG
jgi:hypothetical protein